MKQKKETVPAFFSITETIQEISNENYQLQQWVFRKNKKDYACYENTIIYFLEDCEVIFKSWDANRISMTDKQYIMLKTLYNMINTYDTNDNRPEFDKDIVNDPKWHKIRILAKQLYNDLKHVKYVKNSK